MTADLYTKDASALNYHKLMLPKTRYKTIIKGSE